MSVATATPRPVRVAHWVFTAGRRMGIMTVGRIGSRCRRYRLAFARKGATVVVVHGAKEGHEIVVGSIVRRHIVSSEYDRIADWYLFQGRSAQGEMPTV